MLKTTVIDKLLEIYDNHDAVNPEFNINYNIKNKKELGITEDFEKISFEHYYLSVKSNLYDWQAWHHYIESIFNTIKYLKEHENISEMEYYPAVSNNDVEKSLGHLSHVLINKRFDRLINPWLKLCKNLNIDIDKETATFQDIKNNVNKITEPKEILDELIHVIHLIEQIRGCKLFEDLSLKDDKLTIEKLEHIENLKEYLKKDDTLYNKYAEDKHLLKTLLNKYNIFEQFTDTKKLVDGLKEKVNQKISFSAADEFVKTQSNNNSDLNKFINLKVVPKDNELELNDKGTYKKMVIFDEDKSLLIETHKGIMKPVNSIAFKDEIIETVFKEELNQILKNKPYIAKIFIEKLKEDFKDIKFGIIAAQTYLDNEDILKSANFPLVDEARELFFEHLDDAMNKAITQHKIKNYAHSITSKKYLSLYDEESYDLFKQLYESGVTKEKLQDTIGKKIAAFTSSESFNEALSSYLDSINQFDINTIKDKASLCGADVVIEDDNTLIVRVNNFEQSKIMGTPSWCISRDKSYFKSYTEDNSNQYFIFDFSKQSRDNESMIGLTLTQKGYHSASHLKNDDTLYMNKKLEKIQSAILKKDAHKFPLMTKVIKENKTDSILTI